MRNSSPFSRLESMSALSLVFASSSRIASLTLPCPAAASDVATWLSCVGASAHPDTSTTRESAAMHWRMAASTGEGLLCGVVKPQMRAHDYALQCPTARAFGG